jgi:hypothetical protein
MSRRRRVEEFEFLPATVVAVLARMDALSAAHDGWINVLPGVPEEEVDAPSGGVFSALFGTAQAPVSMCTWIPSAAGRRGASEETVGVLHPRGRVVVRQLETLGVPLPGGWRVRQDHGRRGLVVHPPPETPHAVVLDWMLRAGAALAIVPLTGTWQARVFLPR